MFDTLTEKFTGVFRSLSGRGKISEENIRESMREVRTALLEADVNFQVVNDFTNRVVQKAIGQEVIKSLQPGQLMVKIVYDELVNLLGPVDTRIYLVQPAPTIIMMCGLQGSGKTTTCGKLARLLQRDGLRPMLVAADLQRPAAIEQLKMLGAQIGVPVYSEDPAGSNPVQVCQNGVKAAKKAGDVRVVILDTAGRLAIDEQLMRELRQIDNKCAPDSALLIADAMTGQDAVNSAKAFNEALELDGVILTKTDGDTRGGAALSIKAVTGVPLKFVGTGETLDGIEPFHPDRMASRILGGGDIATLLEKAQREFDADEMDEAQRKMAEGRFTLDDFRKQMGMISKLGSMRGIMKMIPGMGQLADIDPGVDMDKEVHRIGAMIDSMTPEERRNPDRIDRSRRHRIATGSGTNPADVNKLLKDFQVMGGMMQGVSQMGLKDRLKAVQQMAGQAMSNPSGRMTQQKHRSKRGPLDQVAAREKEKKKKKDAKKQRKKNR